MYKVMRIFYVKKQVMCTRVLNYEVTVVKMYVCIYECIFIMIIEILQSHECVSEDGSKGSCMMTFT